MRRLKTETSLVIWLNIVTLVTLSCLLPAQMCEDVHSTPLVNCIVNDGLINAMPNMQKKLLQFTAYTCLDKNLAIANRSRVSCVHNTSRAIIGLVTRDLAI